MEIKPLARVVVIENHTMVRHLLTQLLSDDLGLTVAAECTTVPARQFLGICRHHDGQLSDGIYGSS